MIDRLHLALAQMQPGPNPAASAAALRATRGLARGMGAELVLAPRFALAGWPCHDLARRADFRAACDAALADLAALTAEAGPGLVVGGPWEQDGKLHDALFLLEGGKVAARRARHAIRPGEPFDPGPAPGPVAFRGARLGLMCGEDGEDPAAAETLAETGAELLVNLHADPFAAGWAARRVQQAVARVVETGLGFAFVNMVSGLDEEVCDGGSFALNADRSLAAQLIRFEPDLVLTEWRRGADGWACIPLSPEPDCGVEEEVWRALVLFLRGMAGDGGTGRFRARLLVGLDGGLGPALAALLAVDALGPAGVHAVALGTETAAEEGFARRLGIGFEARPLEPALAPIGQALAPALGGVPDGAVASRLAARLRAASLAAIAERHGMLVLSGVDATMAARGIGVKEGDLAPLRHVGRDLALALARWRNTARPAGLRGPAGAPIPDEVLAVLPLDAAPDLATGSMGAEAARRRAPPGPRIARHPGAREARYPLILPSLDPRA